MTRRSARAAGHGSGRKRRQEPADCSGPSGPLPVREQSAGLPPTRRSAPPRGRPVITIRIRELFG